jgi:hypothetical protein
VESNQFSVNRGGKNSVAVINNSKGKEITGTKLQCEFAIRFSAFGIPNDSDGLFLTAEVDWVLPFKTSHSIA